MGVGHPPQALADVRRPNARRCKIGGPNGTANSFQRSSYSSEPNNSILARNLFAKPHWKACASDESIHLRPEVASIREPGVLTIEADESAKAEAFGVAATLLANAVSGRPELVGKELEKMANDFASRREKLLLPAKPEALPSDRGLRFADWFRSTLAKEMQLVHHWRDSWARCFDALVADGRKAEEIAAVCKWARAERYWCTRFLSPLKLRERDRNQVFYFDRFLAEASPRSSASRMASQVGEHYPETDAPLPRLR
jgi:hypothetical protein